MTVEPWGATLFAEGISTRTVSAGSFDATSCRRTAKPRLCSLASASEYDWPTTSGMPTGCGPLATLMRTTVFTSTVVSALGLCATTVPSGWSFGTVCTSACRFLDWSKPSASDCDMPTTLGTLTCGGPCETTIVTLFP